MSRVLISIGPVQIQAFGLMIVVGILAALFVTNLEAKRRKLHENIKYDLALYLLVGGILGARLFYVFVYGWEYYSTNPGQIIFINQGGLSIHGGILGGLLAGYFFVRRKKISFWNTADMVAPGLILGQAIGRVGCDVFGKPMSGEWFWGVTVAGTRVHPAQLYEVMLDFALFYLLWRYRTKTRFKGQLFLIYAISFAVIRAVVEFFRSNPMVWGPFSVAHVSSLLFIVLAGLACVYLKNNDQAETKIAKAGPRESNLRLLVVTLAMAAASTAGYYLINMILL